MASISLVSVNIEGSKHLDLVDAFLSTHMPEVLCVQELFETDIDRIAQALGAQNLGAQLGPIASKFLPMMYREDPRGGNAVMGVGIFSRLPIVASSMSYYSGDPAIIPHFDMTSTESKHATQNHGVLSVDVQKDGITFRIATTHFTWTPRGDADDFQRQDMQQLLGILASAGEFVLCGDFNAPRILEGVRGEIFGMLADRYKDNIPSSYETSLDSARHRAPVAEQADKMVDGLFTTPAYTASDVALHTGVSDHCAITATITRA